MEEKQILSSKLVREAKKQIHTIWKEENVTDCRLFVNRNGQSALVNGGYHEDGVDAITIGLSRDYAYFLRLVEEGVFSGDFLRFIKFTIYHEIGHKKDQERVRLKQERSRIRRKMFTVETEEEWETLRQLVWEKTFEFEMNAWNYAERYLTSDEHADFRSVVFNCISDYHRYWSESSNLYFRPSVLKVLEESIS